MECLPISDDGMHQLKKALGTKLLAFYDPVLSMSLVWTQSKNCPAGLYACIMPSELVDTLKCLLSHLRFRPDDTGIWSLLTPFTSLEARLIPVSTKRIRGWTTKPFLDSPGCPCLALMARSSNDTQLPEDLLANNVSFSLSVNNKNNLITLSRPKVGPIIELVRQLK